MDSTFLSLPHLSVTLLKHIKKFFKKKILELCFYSFIKWLLSTYLLVIINMPGNKIDRFLELKSESLRAGTGVFA